MNLCQICQAIPFKLFIERPQSDFKYQVPHHSSFQSLEKSVADGCNVCTLLHAKIEPIYNLGPHPCFEARDYDPALFPERRAAILKDERTVLHLSRYVPKQSGVSPIFLVCRFGLQGNMFPFDIEYSDDDFPSSTLYPLNHATISLMKSWLKTCSEEHRKCGVLYDSNFKPTRLIDVGSDRGQYPRLISITQPCSENLEYLTLSHCWGPMIPGPGRTTKATLERYLRQIKLRKLPRTFRDAIAVTRRLGFQYLWIDSLCIIQDSPEDWQRESALMGKVYSHGYCMLAATASIDCHGGLFAKCSELPIIRASISPGSQYVLLKQRYEGWDKMFSIGTLNSRGWTLQERELSPRVIYFTKHTLLFECREARGGERGESRGQAPFRDRKEVLVDKTLIKVDDAQRCMDTLPINGSPDNEFLWHKKQRYQGWREMMQRYSERHLTISTDKFPAISGLASELGYLLDDQYIAGLWRGDVINGLCWSYATTQGAGIARQLDYGPTWSWAKMAAPISYHLVHEGTEPRPVSRSQTELSRGTHRSLLQSSPQNLHIAAWVEPNLLFASTVPAGKDLNGTLLSATLHFEGQIASSRRSKTGNYIVQGESLLIMWDFLPQSASEVFLFSLGKNRIGLVLAADGSNPGIFRRIGIVSDIKQSWFKDVDLQRITLV